MQHNLTLQRKTTSQLNIFSFSLNNPKSGSILKIANALNGLPGVVWAQPNFVQQTEQHNVNDPLYPFQWHLENTNQGGSNTAMDAEDAWALQTGSPDITIAIIDTGVDLGHEDLDIWTNPGEIADNGIDVAGIAYGARILPIKISDGMDVDSLRNGDGLSGLRDVHYNII